MDRNNVQIYLSLSRHQNMCSLFIERASLPYVTSSYVRVQLVDDELGKLDYATSLYQHTVYKEHVSWEMSKEDYICPLRVPIYKRHVSTGDAECVGYVNINLVPLLTSTGSITKWYILQPTQSIIKSQTKHQPSQLIRKHRIHHRLPTSTFTLPSTKVLIIRPSTDASFGLSMAGYGPTHITRIQPQSPADKASLYPGDQIYSIGDVVVHQQSSDQIVQLLKKQSLLTEMCVLRSTTSDTTCDTTLLHRSLPAKLSTTLDTSTTSMLAYHISFIGDTRRSSE